MLASEVINTESNCTDKMRLIHELLGEIGSITSHIANFTEEREKEVSLEEECQMPRNIDMESETNDVRLSRCGAFCIKNLDKKLSADQNCANLLMKSGLALTMEEAL